MDPVMAPFTLAIHEMSFWGIVYLQGFCDLPMDSTLVGAQELELEAGGVVHIPMLLDPMFDNCILFVF